MNVPFFRLSCLGNELKYIREVLESGWLTSSGKALDFEAAFAEKVGARHALAVNSCTAALHLACETAGIGRDSEVLVPSITFTATAEVVEYLGGTVRLVDVDPITGLLDSETLTRALERYPDASCVIPVHLAGRAARMRGTAVAPGLLDLCEAHGLTMVEDAAHAFPAKYDGACSVGGPIGSLATCFSFYANKTITAGEGGMIVTEDDDVASRIRRMRLHGIDRTAWDRTHAMERTWEYDVVAAGYKYNLPDLSAAVGLAQLEQADTFHDARRRIVQTYQERLADLPGLRLPAVDETANHAWHLFIVHLDETSPLGRDAFIERLRAEGIATSVHYKPLHRMSHWANRTGVKPDDLPGAESWWRGCVTLPLFPAMRNEEIDAVCTAVRRVLNAPLHATT
jgi:dTDP-4-amino-4,6-dideoxygalactose transaminase